MLGGKWCFNLFNIPIVEEILDAIIFVWEFHVKCLCIMMPRKLNSSTHSIFTLSIKRVG